MGMEARLLDKSSDGNVDIYWDFRSRLISAQFEAGQKLKPEELRLQYDCSASQLREILFRLSCDGLVEFQDNKGFKVPLASLELCNEAVEHRILIECEGARLSIENGSSTGGDTCKLSISEVILLWISFSESVGIISFSKILGK